MRLLRFLLALAVVAVGIAVGALNSQSVLLDLGFTAIPGSLGIVLLATLLLGVLAGGLVMAVSVILPMRGELKRLRQRPPSPDGGQTDQGV